MQVLWLTLLLAASAFAAAQSPPPTLWQMQESGTTAGLRGIDSVDGTVAWASGTGGTILKTIDGGAHWTKCAIPTRPRTALPSTSRRAGLGCEDGFCHGFRPGLKSRL